MLYVSLLIFTLRSPFHNDIDRSIKLFAPFAALGALTLDYRRRKERSTCKTCSSCSQSLSRLGLRLGLYWNLAQPGVLFQNESQLSNSRMPQKNSSVLYTERKEEAGKLRCGAVGLPVLYQSGHLSTCNQFYILHYIVWCITECKFSHWYIPIRPTLCCAKQRFVDTEYIFTDSVCGKSNAIGRVRPCVCFHSTLCINWPLPFIFACVWVLTTARGN